MLRVVRNASALLFLVAAAVTTTIETTAQDCEDFMSSNCQNIEFDPGGNGYTYENCEPLWCAFYRYCCNEFCEPEAPSLNDCHESGGSVHGACACEE
jgi:hypothetical protein